jgi:hypothetical protein
VSDLGQRTHRPAHDTSVRVEQGRQPSTTCTSGVDGQRLPGRLTGGLEVTGEALDFGQSQQGRRRPRCQPQRFACRFPRFVDAVLLRQRLGEGEVPVSQVRAETDRFARRRDRLRRAVNVEQNPGSLRVGGPQSGATATAASQATSASR